MASFLSDMIDRADTQLMAGWYHTVSVSTERERARMRFDGLRFVDPTLERYPAMGELDLTAERIITRSSTGAGALSGVAGVAGAISVPPELVASMVATLRLGQRLAIVYGFDPRHDRGQMALCRALAAAYDVDLPVSGPVGMRVSDLPGLARRGSSPRSIAAQLTRAVVLRSVLYVAGRLTRLVPVISAASGAVDARRRSETAARRMQGVYRRLSEIPGSLTLQVEDAEEVLPSA